MGEHASWITQFVNHYFGSAALLLLSARHIRLNNPELPIPERVVMGLLVLVVGTLLVLWVRSRLSVERPGASQQVAEFLLTNPLGFGINDVLEENAGHHWESYVPIVGSRALFILIANLIGVYPFLISPTTTTGE